MDTPHRGGPKLHIAPDPENGGGYGGSRPRPVFSGRPDVDI